jgi:hypothetical protein
MKGFFYFENSAQGVQETNLKYGRHPHYQQPPKQQSQASRACDAQGAEKKKLNIGCFNCLVYPSPVSWLLVEQSAQKSGTGWLKRQLSCKGVELFWGGGGHIGDDNKKRTTWNREKNTSVTKHDVNRLAYCARSRHMQSRPTATNSTKPLEHSPL